MAEILIVEDTSTVRRGLAKILSREGHCVREAANGVLALRAIGEKRPDLVLLDVMMPEMNGFDMLKVLRKSDDALPVIFLTACDADADEILGLGLGADDYLAKPVDPAKLVARINAALRRVGLRPGHRINTNAPFGFAGYIAQPRTLTLVCDDEEPIRLSPKEFALIRHFASHPGEVVFRELLLSMYWGVEHGGSTRTLDQHLLVLRKKLGAAGDCLVTIPRAGYRYDPPDK